MNRSRLVLFVSVVIVALGAIAGLGVLWLDSARAGGRTVGLVPTMGYLHEGHEALVRAAAGDCDEVVTTIFVNPLQFAAGEDLEAYPRDIEGDSAKAEAAGSGYLFVPAEEEMYPDGRDGVATSVSVAALAGVM